MGWIHLAQDGDQWRALVIRIINFKFSKDPKISCLGVRLLDSREQSTETSGSIKGREFLE
jgi:hypothetical protein